MNRAICVLLIFVLPLRLEAASGPLQFSARISSERLAEEAIDLLHCLSDALDLPWELVEGGTGSHRLKLAERSGKLEGVLTLPKGESEISLGEGEAETLCRKLVPEEAIALKQEPSSLLDDWQPPKKGPANWIWIAATAAALAGGFFLLKSGKPDHRTFTMD